MVNTQPEALRLADKLESFSLYVNKAADELRHLHEVNQELLKVVEDILPYAVNDWVVPTQWINKASAAIDQATGEQV